MTLPLNLPYLTTSAIQSFIDSALSEDIGEGDHSTLGSIPAQERCSARLLVKEAGIIAGLELARLIFDRFDPDLRLDLIKNDGEKIQIEDIAFTVTGRARSILSTERVVLNCLQRMSGIATYTHRLCHLIEGTSARILDTRKTTPNFRLPEKWAVAIGGGLNHRYALYDMVMLKDNHVDAAGGIRAAIEATKRYLLEKGKNLKIEIETRSLKEVEEVLSVGGVDVIMLDNMSPAEMKKAVKAIGGKFKSEASGGIDEQTIKAVAECGVDFISVGALTHSAKSLDMSLKVTAS